MKASVLASTKLYKPSFFRGVARLFDLFGTLNGAQRSLESDAASLERDWQLTGHDLKRAVKLYARHHS